MNPPSIYIRTSTEDQTPENQMEGINSMLTAIQEGEYSLYKDKQSAWKEYKERPDFERLKRDIKSGKVKELYVWDLDRLHRNRLNLIAFFKLCKVYHCKIHSYRQPWLESLNAIEPPFNEIMHDLMIQIMGWLAEEESNKKSERVKAAIRKGGSITRSKFGNRWGRKPISTQKRNKILECKEAGLSVRKIAQELGIPKSTVHQVIKENPLVSENPLPEDTLKNDVI